MFLGKKIIHPVYGDITEDFYKCLADRINAQRKAAEKRQREVAILRQKLGVSSIIRDEKGNAVAERQAAIDPYYYHAMVGIRKSENKHLKETDGNTWQDDEYLAWQIKKNPELNPSNGKEERYFHPSQKAIATAPIFNPSFNINDSKYNL